MFLALTGVGLTIVSIIAFIIIIGVIITVHELGHLFFAKKAGILCHEFSIGMGPILYKKQFGETRFCVRAIPIGGFVSMAGEEIATSVVKVGDKIGLNLDSQDEATEIILDDNKDATVRGEITDVDLYCEDGGELHVTLKGEDEEEKYYKVKNDAFYIFEKNERLQITPYDRCFESKTKIQRFLTLFAGAFMNFVLAIIVCIIVAVATGVPDSSSTKIGTITSNFPASKELKVGDEIKSINGKSVYTWTDFSSELANLYKDYSTTVNLVVNRDGKDLTISMQTVTVYNYIGISNVGATNMMLSKVPGYEIYGLEIGNTSKSYRFVNQADSTYEYNLKTGDYLVGISINDKEYDLTEEKTVTVNSKTLTISGWGYLSYVFDDAKIGEGAPNVKFKYYHKTDDTYKLIDYADSKAISPYTDEVLRSQNVDAVVHGIGVSPVYKFDLFKSLPNAFKQFGSDCSMIFNTLRILIWPSDVRQVGVSDLSSVVGIFSLVENYVGAGFLSLLAFVAMLSVNIGIVNLLPIPALDGGRILFLGIEAVTRKRVPRKVENIINNVAFILLMILFVYVTYNDIVRLIK
ncbi:MAG: site-2 protease family protein [Acholeplasmatales bacterium]|nr:site-2 protease family protein [Acholeplasmatales bacterium]